MAQGARWLLLIHQIPPSPSYLRVKVGRRLQSIGSVPVKNSVYVLPRRDEALEDFQWIRREIVAGGGDASVCEASFVEGLSDDAVEALFSAARNAEYESLEREVERLQESTVRRGKRPPLSREQIEAGVLRLRKRLLAISEVDFFGARGREVVEGRLVALESSVSQPHAERGPGAPFAGEVRGRTWVTRTGVHIDRIASAWLIRRFIDPEARFRFVSGTAPLSPDELRFDMFEGEFTHEGDACTFEVLKSRFRLEDRALVPIAEIVHDVDLKDGKFQRAETPGVDHLIAGVALGHKEDEKRIEEGGAIFEALYQFFRRRA